MNGKDVKKMEFLVSRTPVKARLYVDEMSHSTRTQISGIDLSKPLNVTELYDLKAALTELLTQAEIVERGL